MLQLDPEEQAIVDAVAAFVDKEVKPKVQQIEHANEYPTEFIEQMKQMGIFGLAIPEPYGDVKVSTPCYSRVTEELARGWLSLAASSMMQALMGTWLVYRSGSDELHQRLLEPAIRRAREGYPIIQTYANILAEEWPRLQAFPATVALFGAKEGARLAWLKATPTASKPESVRGIVERFAQVLIEAIIMEVKVGDNLDYGFSYIQKNPTDFGNTATGIGAIRTERELVESLLFPANTIARVIATSGRADSSRRGHARGCRPTMSRALTTATSGSHPSYAGPRPSGKATNAITRPARALLPVRSNLTVQVNESGTSTLGTSRDTVLPVVGTRNDPLCQSRVPGASTVFPLGSMSGPLFE